MTTGPKLRLGKTLIPGLLAVGLFGVMALITLNAAFEPMAQGGFPDGVSITAELGYALFGFDELQTIGGTESFLAAVLLVAVALDAALDAALVLAKREEQGEPVAALSSTGEAATTGEGPAPAVADGGEPSETRRSTSDQRSDGGERPDGDSETGSGSTAAGGESR